MKKFIPILASVFFVACNSAPQKDAPAQAAVNTQATVDTAGLADYQSWKAQNEIAPVQEHPVVAAAKPVVQVRTVRQPVRVVERVIEREVPVETPRSETKLPDLAGNGDVASSDGAGTGTDAGTAQAPAEEKKKVSNSTKGAVIGGVVGGAAGAVISKKNRVVGGIVGGVVGAAVGYGIGKKKDQKQ